MSLESLQKEVNLIKNRNKKVEADKAWETSLFRKVSIAIMTYIVVVVFLWLIESPNYWLNALVPTAGFLLSTLSIPFIKRWWVRNRFSLGMKRNK